MNYRLTLYEFNVLNENEKAQLVWDKGIFLHNRVEGNIGYGLYHLFDFYVEVQNDNEINEIIKIRSFKSISMLDPYLLFLRFFQYKSGFHSCCRKVVI